MRSFKNGTLNMVGDDVFGLPPKNTARAPLENNPAPHVLRMLDPERMFRKSNLFCKQKFGIVGFCCVDDVWRRQNAFNS